MHTTDLIHRPPVDWPTRPASERPALAPSYHQLISPVRNAILRARREIEVQQRPDGSWLARQCGDSSLAGPFVLLLAFLEDEYSELAEQAATAVRADQRANGTWSRSPDGPADVSVSVAAYFALKIVGDAPTEPHMARARQAIRELGGADAVDATTRLWLAVLGQIDFDCCAPIATEWMLLPEIWQRCAIGVDVTDSERCRLTATAVVLALRPERPIELARGVRELFLDAPENWVARAGSSTCWTRAWTWLSRLCERARLLPFRARALDLAETLLTRAAREVEARETGFAELVWQIVALRALGYPADSSERAACDMQLRQIVVVDDTAAARPLPPTTSTTDTIQSLAALAASGVARSQSVLANGTAWLAGHLLGQQRLDGAETTCELATLLIALADLTNEPNTDGALPPDIQLSRDRVARFLARHRHRRFPLEAAGDLAIQVCDELLVRLRTSDTVEEIGAALEALARHRLLAQHRAMTFGAQLLRTIQRADGSWGGADDSPSISATASAIRGLVAVGTEIDDPTVAAGVNWLLVHECETGGWGDVPQTARAVWALTTAGAADYDATRRGIAFLLDRHEEEVEHDGDHGDLSAATASLAALSRWAIAAAAIHADVTPPRLRLVGDLSLVN